jgi:hypothetical protein
MFNCRGPFNPKSLDRYVMKRLTEADRREVDQHLERCHYCRGLITETRILIEAIRPVATASSA